MENLFENLNGDSVSFNPNAVGDSATNDHINNIVDGSAPQASTDKTDLKIIVEELIDSSSESDADFDEILDLIDQQSDNEELLLVDIFQVFEGEKRNSIKNYIAEVMPTYTDEEFRQHFRITKDLLMSLSSRFEVSEHYKNIRPDIRIPATTHLAVFLWFAGHEACSFRDLSDRFNLSISSISRIIDTTSTFISSLSPGVIKWPSEEKKRESSCFFDNKYGFSKAIGSIDGTHIVINPPDKCKDEYIDRKGNVSICMQAVCDENKKFINIFIGFPGSCHDSWVLKNSPLYQNMPSLCGGYHLLGDSAYPCTQYLVTPYKDNGHLTRAQKNFNVKLSSARVGIEHSFGMLKQRFRQLYYCKLKGIKKLCHFIRACCVLHNIANESDLQFMPEENDDEILYNDQPGELSRGNAVRDLICRDLQSKPNNNTSL